MSPKLKTYRKKESEPFRSITVWDVLYRHLAKVSGIIAVLVLGSITLLRCAPEDIPNVAKTIFSSNLFGWTGWIIAVIVLLIAAAFLKYDRKTKAKELSRLCDERDRLQEKLLKRAVSHSGNGNKK